MQVVFGEQMKEELGDRFTLLELDTFTQEGLSEPITAYAVIGGSDVQLQDLPTLENFSNIHNTMLVEYRRKNWNYCHQAMAHLKGKWGGQLDSFYDEFSDRIKKLEQSELSAEWNGVIHK